MPIYEYRCSACGFQKEFLQRMSDAPPTDCPECGKPALAKMVTAAGFQLKGSGWYATDFKNGSGSGSGGGTSVKKAPEPSTDSGKKDESSASSAQPSCGAGACPACN
jgi:putative FmdB family regulatory protein